MKECDNSTPKIHKSSNFILFVSILIRLDTLTLTPLMWRIWWAPNNASKWQMGFNSAFKVLMYSVFAVSCRFACLNGGACVGPDQCECPRNATGATCADPVCDPPCENGATCSSGNRCLCEQGTSGTRCEKRYGLIWIINLVFLFLIKWFIFLIGLSWIDVTMKKKSVAI
jgi:hypothetical protein